MRSTIVKAVVGTGEGLWMTLPLRAALGVIFFAHGAQKLFGWFGGRGLRATAQRFEEKYGLRPGILWASLNASGEFCGGVMVFLGLLTRPGALLISVSMLVAILRVHRRRFFLPGGMEFPLALLGPALALLIAGGGALSFDRLLRGGARDGRPVTPG